MAAIGSRPDRGAADPFYGHAATYVRSIYLDAILIGLLQQHGITDLEEQLAAAMEDSAAPGMDQLESAIATFRHQLWWQHLSAHGVPNQLLIAYHQQHRLPERFQQILTEVQDFNRLARDTKTLHVNNVALLFSLTTVPVGIALGILQLLGPHSPWLYAAVALIFTGLTAGLLSTRTGRLVIHTIRRRLTI